LTWLAAQVLFRHGEIHGNAPDPLTAARTLNFTRAAEECNVAQPSLTRAIQQLEEELGGDLFRRDRKLSHLTDLGQRMLPLMQQCYDMAQGAKSLAGSIKRGEIARNCRPVG
jgi:DNA-binding transcriptional LysR family regulator